ncbi:NAD(P)/FAD-dependent oxidoreductase, partial [bacterium]|nr:NAD(P)/FAD-dependent oxidoreductase [bacterium]
TMPKAFDLGNPRVMTSTEALEVEEIPANLLIVGGGYIGMELGTVYSTLGSKVVLVEALPNILSGADQDLVRPVLRHSEKHFHELRPNTKVTKMATSGKQIKVTLTGQDGKPDSELYDRVLVSIGRTPNAQDLGLENTKVKRDAQGFVKVNANQQTDDPALYAIGDVCGGALLAHKAAREARVAVEVITGEFSAFDNIIPAVVFTDPAVAWVGLTETDARERDIKIEVARFPWSASGRALSVDRPDGLTKLIIEPDTERLLGIGICGHGAGELIAEGVLAIEMGATAHDLALCVHPHPTLSETIMEAAEAFYGHATHTFSGKKR